MGRVNKHRGPGTAHFKVINQIKSIAYDVNGKYDGPLFVFRTVDRSRPGQGLGKYLLFDAFHRVLQAAETLAVYALVVDTKNDEAHAFYEHYGFLCFPETPPTSLFRSRR